MNRLTDKTALITGAARGLGAKIAESFIAEGANVIINDINITAAQATAERLGGQALACDVSDSASVARMFEELFELTDRLDILVNNAGISGIEGDNTAHERIRRAAQAMADGAPAELDSGITEVTDDQWRRLLGVHMDGTFYCSRSAAGLMKRAGSGNIINMGQHNGYFRARWRHGILRGEGRHTRIHPRPGP